MKKIIYTIMSLMVAAFSLQSCEDVPAPYDIPGESGGDTPAEEEISAQGNGSIDSPYNVAGILAATASLESGSSLDGTVYVTGIVTSVKECSASYGNATFYLGDTDDATNTFYVYRCLGLNNKNITSDDAVQEGDTVTICGTITNYNGTIETTQKGAYIYKSSRLGNGNNGGGSTPSGEVIVKTCAEASAIALALTENNVATTETYSITGYITNIASSVSKGQQTFWMDDTIYGGKVFEAYWANLPEGESEFTVGSKVTIVGNLMKFNTTPEIKNATVTILEAADNTGGNNDDNTGGNTGGSTASSSFTNGDFESWTDGLPTGWKSACTASSATLSQSTDAHGGSYSVCVAGNESANKRLAYQELTLEAGTYTFSFYAKGSADPSQVRPGYVPVTDGSVGTYSYGDYATISNSWAQYSYTFTLDAKSTICLVIMNPKKSNYSSGADVLIDDATLAKSSSAKRIARRR